MELMKSNRCYLHNTKVIVKLHRIILILNIAYIKAHGIQYVPIVSGYQRWWKVHRTVATRGQSDLQPDVATGVTSLVNYPQWHLAILLSLFIVPHSCFRTRHHQHDTAEMILINYR